MEPAPQSNDRRFPAQRAEAIALALLLAVGFALRAWSPSSLAIEHFDEGVYASNLYFDEEEGFSYPDRHLYAPPLVPWILELSITLLGATVPGCFGLGILTGTATIAAVWWIARRWFGPIAALSAATLIAFSGPHIVFSRTALTDVPMGLWFTLSLGLLGESFRHESRGYAVAAGVAVALAWWSKYNGWLPLAIGLAGMLAWLLTARPGWAIAKRCFLCWGIAAVTAMVLWSPVWWGLQSKGGYAAVAANHARYFHGLSGWWDAFRQQMANLRILDDRVLGFSVVVAVWFPISIQIAARSVRPDCEDWLGRVASRLIPSRSRQNPTADAFVVGLAVFFLTLLVLVLPSARISYGFDTAALAGAVAGIAAWRSKSGFPALRNPCGLWLCQGWFIGLTLLTPLYRPYARLTIPWILGAVFCISILVGATGGPRRRQNQGLVATGADRLGGAMHAPWWQAVLGGVGTLMMLIALAFSLTLLDPRRDRADVARATFELRSAMQDDARRAARKPDCVAYVYAEPAVFFHLAGQVAAGPVGDLEFASPTARQMPMPVYLVVGPHARRSERFADQWAARGDRFEKVGEWSYRPSLVVLLDHYHPDEVRDPHDRPTETIELYRLK